MKAVCVKEPGHLEITERPVPAAGKGEVRIRVRGTGICRSDMHIFHGRNPLVKYPRIVGREFAGEIVALGKSVEGFSIGDHVAVDPVLSCGVCRACISGHRNVCPQLQILGIHLDGGMAEYVTVPAANVYPVPVEWSWNKAAMVEPFAVAANILSRTSCSPADRVLIMGAGPVGLTVLLGAIRTGAQVAVADVLESRLELARSLGAHLLIDSGRLDVENEVEKWTGGEGVSLIVDVICLPEIFSSLLKMASPAGRIAHLSFSEQPAAIIPAEITKKELSILGSRLNCNMFPLAIRWFAEGLDPEKLISHTFPFTQALDALKLIEENPLEALKVVLTFQEPSAEEA